MRYRKKPVIIDAIQFTRQNVSEIMEFVGKDCDNFLVPRHPNGKATCEIHTLEGTLSATEGDYIIKGVNGEFYPCKEDIFKQTYELAPTKPAFDITKHENYDDIMVCHTEDECLGFMRYLDAIGESWYTDKPYTYIPDSLRDSMEVFPIFFDFNFGLWGEYDASIDKLYHALHYNDFDWSYVNNKKGER